MVAASVPARTTRLVALDMDGTLTQHKTPLGQVNHAALEALRSRYRLVMVGAGMCQRIHRQLGGYPIDVIGAYGMEAARWDEQAAQLRIVERSHVDPLEEGERTRVIEVAENIRRRHGYTDYQGDSVEFHASGMLTFAMLGTDAPIEDKLAFDPDRSRRRAFYGEVRDAFSDYTVFVGGSSSFDIVPRPFDKLHALTRYCAAEGIALEEVTFIGDDYGPGGNDEQVFLSDRVESVPIDDYRSFPAVAAELLAR